MKTKSLIIAMFMVCFGAVSLNATNNSTKNTKTIEAAEVVSYITTLSEVHKEMGHTNAVESLLKLQKRYNLEEELSYARTYLISETEMQLVMVAKDGSATVVNEELTASANANWIGCYCGSTDPKYNDAYNDPAIQPGELGWCEAACSGPGVTPRGK